MKENNEKRIWGHFTVLYDAGNVKVKELHVDPSRCLSYQRHEHRSEHWVIQQGIARMIYNNNDYVENDKSCILQKGDTFTIPVGHWHQVINIGKEPLVIVETQYGKMCEEDDIERKFQ